MRQHLNKFEFHSLTHKQTDKHTLSFVNLCIALWSFVLSCIGLFDHIWLYRQNREYQKYSKNREYQKYKKYQEYGENQEYRKNREYHEYIENQE